MNNLKQLETREVNVGENIFYIRPLPAFKAANMTGELAALVLPLVSGLAPLLSAVDTEKEGNGLLDIKVEDAAPAIAGAFSSLDGDKVEKILKHLLIAGSNISVEQPGEKARLLTEDLANEVFCTDVQDKHWDDLKKNGCSDPAWPDGVNLNLVRNHIIYWYRLLRERTNQTVQLSMFDAGMDLRNERPLPPEVPDRYMVPTGKYPDRLNGKWDGLIFDPTI